MIFLNDIQMNSEQQKLRESDTIRIGDEIIQVSRRSPNLERDNSLRLVHWSSLAQIKKREKLSRGRHPNQSKTDESDFSPKKIRREGNGTLPPRPKLKEGKKVYEHFLDKLSIAVLYKEARDLESTVHRVQTVRNERGYSEADVLQVVELRTYFRAFGPRNA